MCTVCGCGDAKVEGLHQHHDHGHGHAHNHDHEHKHEHHHHDEHDLHFGHGIAGVHVPGLSQTRIVQIEQDILGHNNHYAVKNRGWLTERGIFAVNLVSSPGSGKTTLLCRTVSELKERWPLAVIEGDQQTSFDADRIRATGVPALQVNTGKGCHLDAHMVGHALEKLPRTDDGVLFIENVGNLVCPAAFDLGEACKVVILSVTEGEDKPLKYPDMFHAAELMILNKIDLLPHLSFDVERCVGFARRVNPGIQLIKLSATSGEGMTEWQDWLAAGRRASLKRKTALLEARLRATQENLGK